MARLTGSLLHISTLPVLSSFIASSLAAPLPSNQTEDCFPPPNSVASSIEWTACPEEAQLLAAPSNTTAKVGSLFVNPGGPGGSATELVAAIAGGAIQSEAVLASFDFIGLDPRGVGLSRQVRCDEKIYAERVSLFPKTREEFDALEDKNKRLGTSCRELTGPLLEHVDTISAVKDHEAVRIALGNEPFNYLGLSYGAQLGALYAALFPNNIRSMALDGITQHSQGQAANILIESSSYAVSLKRFFEWASTDESSPLKGQDMETFWYSLLGNATESPIPAAGCNDTDCRADVNAEDILFATQPSMVYATGDVSRSASWGVLASALYNASEGDATAFATSFTSPTAYSGLAIGCLDWTTTPTFSASLQKQIMGGTYTPLTLGASQSYQIQQQCIGWPAPVVNPPKKLDIKTEVTILLVISEADPETGYPWAIGMLEEFENKVLVTRKGAGHTSFALGGETSEVMAMYLITGVAPKEGLLLDS
ncbi:alpha/beta-hydrolase [Lentithecium fluviatile CBS 122367]|uniref:Alpha/beta-hydrolase n=1 Tax=Lentithecium fluviatile CBS 122367 TaxID=1168545 RepID=A0A6G1ILK0_9PLEO|nr:alpha/beta-hydrolase [Lentithecium fluviatile CBS 122367]